MEKNLAVSIVHSVRHGTIVIGTATDERRLYTTSNTCACQREDTLSINCVTANNILVQSIIFFDVFKT